MRREMLDDILLNNLDTKIRIVDALDLVADTADCKFQRCQQSDMLATAVSLLSLFARRDSSTNSRGVRPVSRALENIDAASSRAPPNRLPIVNRPDARDEIRSLPAREATIVFMALDDSTSK